MTTAPIRAGVQGRMVDADFQAFGNGCRRPCADSMRLDLGGDAGQASRRSRAWAAASDEPGFWPVTSRPSVSTCDCQSAVLV